MKLHFVGLLLILFTLTLSPVEASSEQFDGIIEPSEIVEVSSQVPGVLEELNVERGDIVKAGQILATLMSNVEKATVELAAAKVEFGKRKMIRNEELYKKQLISVHEKDELETEVQLSKLQHQETIEHLKMRTISSTIDGVVMERLLSPGEYVGENPILKIAKINPLYIEVVVPVEKFGSIKKGMMAKVMPESAMGGTYTGKVVIVDQVIDAASGTFGVRLELPNPSFRLPAGLKCKVRFLKK